MHPLNPDEDGPPPASGALGAVAVIGLFLLLTTALIGMAFFGDHLPEHPGHQMAFADAGWAGRGLVAAAVAGACGYLGLVVATWVAPARLEAYALLIVTAGVPVLLLHLGLAMAVLGGR